MAESIVGRIHFMILRGNITFSEMPYYYNAADCLIFTSDFEGSPCNIQEAIACNLPIVSVDVGDVKEQIKNISHSYITNRDANEIGKKLAEVLILQKRSVGYIKIEKIDKIRIISKIIDLYYNILK